MKKEQHVTKSMGMIDRVLTHMNSKNILPLCSNVVNEHVPEHAGTEVNGQIRDLSQDGQ